MCQGDCLQVCEDGGHPVECQRQWSASALFLWSATTGHPPEGPHTGHSPRLDETEIRKQ